MAKRSLKPMPLVITPEDTIPQRKAGRYLCTATWGSPQEAEKGKNRPYRMRDAHPLHDGQLSRLGWWGQTVVGHIGVLRTPIRLGRVTLLAAGIAGVCTDPRARNHGIASMLLRDSLEASRQAGISFSLLFGIPGFYHQFGFVPALPGHRYLFSLEKNAVRPRRRTWRPRQAKPADVPRMLELHDRFYNHLDGTMQRDPRIFLRRKRSFAAVLHGPGRGDWAYLIIRKTKIDDVERMEVTESAGQGTGWEDAVIDWAIRDTLARQQDRFSLYLPPGHPISRRMVFHNATQRTRHASNADAMVAVLDFVGLARDMGPEWSARLAAARVRLPKEGLVVTFRQQAYRWHPDRKDGQAVALPKLPARPDVEFSDALARLVMGYGDPEAVMRHYGMRARESALPAIHAIFAERQLAFSAADFF